MSRGRGTVNKVILVGRLGADPQLKYTPSGKANANFNIATNFTWKDQSGNKQDKTDWHRVVVWGKLAEVVGEWLKKGSYVYIEGRIQTRSYNDNNGVKKWVTEVVATDLEMLGRKNGETEAAGALPEVEAGSESEGEEESDLPF
ncbi:single-stranded DNA-binding protein [bacterium]|nr:single-stranded DNA-binding protein [bacterium]